MIFAGLFRNPISEVSRFFKVMHPSTFKIYNLCPELPYPHEPFDGSVRLFDVQDHTPPRLAMLVEFCNEAHEWLSNSDEHVVAVHCRGGKVRRIILKNKSITNCVL